MHTPTQMPAHNPPRPDDLGGFYFGGFYFGTVHAGNPRFFWRIDGGGDARRPRRQFRSVGGDRR